VAGGPAEHRAEPVLGVRLQHGPDTGGRRGALPGGRRAAVTDARRGGHGSVERVRRGQRPQAQDVQAPCATCTLTPSEVAWKTTRRSPSGPLKVETVVARP